MYGKIFESMYDGTLASKGPWEALVTFQQMIVLANRDGVVDMTAIAISRRTSIPIDIITVGIRELMRPDAGSRTEGEEGRRIVYLDVHRDWGWQIVNYAKYRNMRNAEDRREYLRVAKQRSRERQTMLVNTSQQMSPEFNRSTHADADADADATTPSSSAEPKTAVEGFGEFWSAYPRKVGKDAAAKAFAKRKPDAALLAAMLAAIEAQRSAEQWRRDGGQYIPHPATWLNQGRWQDEVNQVATDERFRGAR
jgi:hypothetical protein